MIEKRTTPIEIDFVDVNLRSQNSVVSCESDVDVKIGFYGDVCCVWSDTAPDGADESLLEIDAKNGKDGANTIDVKGALTITLAATNHNWIFGGNGGNGGDAMDTWGMDADDGADGGNGGYAISAKEIYAKVYDKETVIISGGWGGDGGKGGHAYGIFGGSSWLYDDGENGAPGKDSDATNVEIVYISNNLLH